MRENRFVEGRRYEVQVVKAGCYPEYIVATATKKTPKRVYFHSNEVGDFYLNVYEWSSTDAYGYDWVAENAYNDARGMFSDQSWYVA